MKVSVLSLALMVNAQVLGQRNGNVNRLRARGNSALKLASTYEEASISRKLSTVNEDGLSKRQQRKKEMASAPEELTMKADEADTAVGGESETANMSMHETAPEPPAPKHHRDHLGKDPLQVEPLQVEPLPVKAEVKDKHTRKKEGKPGKGIAEDHTKELAPKSPKLG